MFDANIKDILIKKGKHIGIDYTRFIIEPIGAVPFSETVYVGPFIQMNNDSDQPTLMVGDLRDYDDIAIESSLEHQVCIDSCFETGKMERTIAILSPELLKKIFEPEMLWQILISSNTAYFDYIASKHHKSLFGQGKYNLYHLTTLEKFVPDIADAYEEESDPIKKTGYIFALVREACKSSLLGHDHKILPEVIRDISKPLVSAFEIIENSDLSWDSRADLIFFTGVYLCTHLDLIRSYEKGSQEFRGGKGVDLVIEFENDLYFENVSAFATQPRGVAEHIENVFDFHFYGGSFSDDIN